MLLTDFFLTVSAYKFVFLFLFFLAEKLNRSNACWKDNTLFIQAGEDGFLWYKNFYQVTNFCHPIAS